MQVTPFPITTPGQSETFKAGVHLALFGLAVTAGAYNLAALQARPSRQLAVNAVIYGALAWFEARNVLGHMGRLPGGH